MKKVLTLVVLLTVLNSKSQSFYKGALVIDANGGIEFYNTKVEIHNKTTGKDTTQTDNAANFHYTFGAEYGINKTTGVGLRFRNSTYLTEKDTVNNVYPTLKSTDILVQVNYHAYTKKAFDFVVGVDAGYTGMRWDLKDKESTKIKAGGACFSAYLNPRVYIGPVGFNMKIGTPYFSYPKLKSNNENFNKTASYKLKGSPGFLFELGIQFRFLKNTETVKQ